MLWRILFALSHVEQAFRTRDASVLGTINEHLQPVADAATDWIRHVEAERDTANATIHALARTFARVDYLPTELAADARGVDLGDPRHADLLIRVADVAVDLALETRATRVNLQVSMDVLSARLDAAGVPVGGTINERVGHLHRERDEARAKLAKLLVEAAARDCEGDVMAMDTPK